MNKLVGKKPIDRVGQHFRSKLNGTLYAVVWNDIDGEQMLLNLNDYHIIVRLVEEESFQLITRMLELEPA